jgi:hypothetical protein
MMLTRMSCLLVCLAACGAAAPRRQRLPTAVAKLEVGVAVHDVWISTPTAVAPSGGSRIGSTRSTVQLAVRVPFDCKPDGFLVREHEGSYLGSHGIDLAVTYYEPHVIESRCTPAATPREYVLSVVWERRNDVPWTIVVASYTGTADRIPNAALYVKALANHVERRPARADAITVDTSGEALVNAPKIERVDVRRDGNDLLVALDLEYDSDCVARWMPWHLEVRSVRVGDQLFLWAIMERSPMTEEIACGDIYAPEWFRATYRIPVGGGKVSIAIPNVDGRDELPIFRKSL